MTAKKNIVILMILLLFNSFGGMSQKNDKAADRMPYAAGKFYSSDKNELSNQLKQIFNKINVDEEHQLRAIICPHAGYVYSGEVAAYGIKMIPRENSFKNIFVIASSHRTAFSGASIYFKGDYITPLGKVEVNKELASKLANNNLIFTFKEDAHLYEHSLEVQLPLLQYWLGNSFRIIPIIIGTQNQKDCKTIAEALEPYFNNENLFVISTDFSHYPAYDDAVTTDSKTADAIISNSVDELTRVLRENKNEQIPDLATSLCSWSSVYTLLYLTEGDKSLSYKKIKYMNSGDQPFGDKSGVVGYYSIAVTGDAQKINSEEFQISENDKQDLLKIARETLQSYINDKSIPRFDHEQFSENLGRECGVFVTLNKNHKLRGCIGRFISNEPLYKLVCEMTIASSTQDSRFPRVKPSELDDIEIEISVLTPLKKIESIEEIELGKHGIYIKKGNHSGTFLPQVATQTSWNIEEFLGHCARDKARIGWEGWKDADIYIYEAIVFEESDFD